MTDAQKQARLAEIDREIGAITAQIDPLSDRRAALNQERISLKSKFQVGDIVAWERYGKPLSGKVVKLTQYFPLVALRKKDGTFSTVKFVHVYDTDAATLVAAAPHPTEWSRTDGSGLSATFSVIG